MLSILIPTFNDECLGLVRTLSRQTAALKADECAVEIIVADDCSTDEQVKTVNAQIDQIAGCRILWSHPNKGRAGIRNFLAAQAQGEWLLFIDSGMGISNPDFVRNYLAFTKETEPAVVYGGYKIEGDDDALNGNLRYRYERKNEHLHTIDRRKAEPYRDFHTSNFLVHYTVIQRIPLNEDMKKYGFEDVLWGKQLKEAGVEIHHIDNPVLFDRFESNAEFLRKTEESVRTQYEFRHLIGEYSTLIKTWETAEKLHLAGLFRLFYKFLGGTMKSRLLSKNPSIFEFNLYKLFYFCTFAKETKMLTK